MNTKFISLVILALFTSITLGQSKIKGNKNVTIIQTEINSFNKLVLGEKFTVSLIKDNVASIEIKTDENLHDVIKFNVSDSILRLKTTKRITSKKELEITVRYTESLNEIELNDDAELNSVNAIDNSNVVLRLNDDAKANLNLRTHTFKLINNNTSTLKLNARSRFNIDSKLVELELNESSSSEALITCDSLKLDMYQRAFAKIEGDVKFLKANTINSSNFIGKNLAVNYCEIIAEDSSDFEIQALDDIIIESSGSSEVFIYGDPKITINKFSDTARLYKKEL